MSTAQIPVTVLTGFLGAGKTTLLNRLLASQHDKKIAVIENEFGEVGVDNLLVIDADEEIFEMNNGCICCTVRGDLIRILTKLAQRPDRLDAVIIETTGMANPGPVALTFFSDPEIIKHFRLDGIVTLVDTRHIALHWDDSDEAKKQIAFADVILLNKVDLVPADAVDVVESRIRRMNPAAKLHRTEQADVKVSHVLDIGGFNLERATDLDPAFLDPEYPFEWCGVFDVPTEGIQVNFEAGPDPEMDVALLPLDGFADSQISAVLDEAVRLYSSDPGNLHGGASVNAGSKLQRLNMEHAPTSYVLKGATSGIHAFFTQHHPDEFAASFTVNGRRVETLWSNGFKPNHSHDDEVGSVGITFSGALDAQKLDVWISALLKERGKDIFRSKGVLNVHGHDRRLVFQGVHMLFDAKFDRPWGDAARENTIVFIGRDLDREALRSGIKSCLVHP